MSFTSWDHDNGTNIGNAICGNIVDFLEYIREEFEDCNEQSDFAPISIHGEYNYAKLSLTGIGGDKTKTLVFMKKYFNDIDYQQTKERIKEFPIHIISAIDEKIDEIEHELAEKGLEYRRETITEEEFFNRKQS